MRLGFQVLWSFCDFLFLFFLGKELDESGVLSESVRLRKDFWGLHMPLVCPDGAVVAYAWKRQLAGQAGASAVDRTRFGSYQLVPAEEFVHT